MQDNTLAAISQSDWERAQAHFEELELSLQLLREDVFTLMEEKKRLEREVERLTSAATTHQ